MNLNTTAVFLASTIVFLVLFIVYRVKFNQLQNSSSTQTPSTLLAWSKGSDSGSVTFSASDILNKYWYQGTAFGAPTITFPNAIDVVNYLAANNYSSDEYYMIINNGSGFVISPLLFYAGTGNTLSGFSDLLNAHYIILHVEINRTSESVTYTNIQTGTNAA
jgi:hypothetical protein